MSTTTVRVLFFDLGDTLVRTADRSWIPGAQDALQRARAAGLKLGVISNTGTLSRDRLASLLPADFDWKSFDRELVILSSEVGLEKPSLEIFRKALAAADGPASSCLFCTEDLVDTLVAQRAGMLALRVLPPPRSDLTGFMNALVKAGLIPPCPGPR